jgi:hypothetical protein
MKGGRRHDRERLRGQRPTLEVRNNDFHVGEVGKFAAGDGRHVGTELNRRDAIAAHGEGQRRLTHAAADFENA